MHIEVFKGKGKQPWRWHFSNKGRTTADSEGFPTKAHAVRAGRSVVMAICKCLVYPPTAFMFTRHPENADGITVIKWQ